MSKYKKILTCVSIIIIFVIGLFIRLSSIINFPSEMDDHIVASSIIRAQKPLNINLIKISIYDSSKTTFNSIPKRLLRTIDKQGKLNIFLNSIQPLIPYFAVSNETTYAPFQFFFTKKLIDKDNELTENLLLGRLPSFIISIFSLFLLFIVLLKYLGGNFFEFGLVYVAMHFFYCYEFAIYSVQMESYAIGVLALLLLILVLIIFINNEGYTKISNSIFFGSIVGLLVYFQYQILFFVTASYLTILFILFNEKKLNFKILINGLASLISFLFFFLPLYFLFLSKHTNHVKENISLGIKSEYNFTSYKFNSITQYIEYFIKYFSNSFFDVFRNLTMTFSFNSFFEILFLILNFVFFILGIVYVLREKKRNVIIFKIFTIFSIVVWVLLIVFGSINLSPDRHSLILLPFFVIYIFFGARKVFNKFSSVRHIDLMYTIFIVVYSYFFLKSHNDFFKDRFEPYNSQKFTLILNKYNPELIVARDNIIYLMPELYNSKVVYFHSSDMSRSEWVSSNTVLHEPNFIAFIGDSSTETLEKNFPEEVKNKILPNHIKFEDKYYYFDSVQIKSRTDEINEKFTRLINLRVKIFKKI